MFRNIQLLTKCITKRPYWTPTTTNNKHTYFIDEKNDYTNKQIKLLTDWYLRVRKSS